MKVCVISTTVLPCPPAGYSGLEMVAYLQAKTLAERGHKVLLVAPIGSKPPPGVELHGTTMREGEKQAYSGYWQRLPGFDVIIDNSWEKWAYMLKIEGKLNAPVLGVIHAPASTMYQKAPPVEKPCIVAISKDQASDAESIWKVKTRVAYNGIDTDFYKAPLGSVRNDRYLFLARMSTIKGPDIAVNIAEKLQIGLDLVGDDKITGEPDFAEKIKARAVGKIVYHGGQSREKCVEFFSTRKVLLHANLRFREPFGLAPVEALSAGMPVIAFDNGAMRETIVHGVTGFLVKTEQEMEQLVKDDACRSISEDACRAQAEKFSVKVMGDTYNALCTEARDTGGW
jgi:glycosyltransferase involved in cell wall biosynthesis